MDIFAHGLWTAAGARIVNKKKKDKPLNIWWAMFWGVFPDIFAFGIPFVVLVYGIITGHNSITDFHRNPQNPEANFPMLGLAYSLYNISHSLVTCAVVFVLAYATFRRPVWELLGWLLHICIDIPTHAATFFPTPLFWPISSWKFVHGISWGIWWFQLLNYTALVIVYIWLWRKNKDRDVINETNLRHDM